MSIKKTVGTLLLTQTSSRTCVLCSPPASVPDHTGIPFSYFWRTAKSLQRHLADAAQAADRLLLVHIFFWKMSGWNTIRDNGVRTASNITSVQIYEVRRTKSSTDGGAEGCFTSKASARQSVLTHTHCLSWSHTHTHTKHHILIYIKPIFVILSNTRLNKKFKKNTKRWAFKYPVKLEIQL